MEAELNPVEQMLLLIVKQCKTAVLERDYIDVDHRACLTRFYRLRHRDTRTRCTRVHLFGEVIARENLENGLVRKQSESYLGFVVLRPFSHDTLGRAYCREL